METQTKHTPGPWKVEIEADCDDCQADIYVCHPNTVCDVTVVCTMGQSANVSPTQKLADARLIAAVPELAEALRELLNAVIVRTLRGRDHVPSMREEQDAVKAARAALAKAGVQ